MRNGKVILPRLAFCVVGSMLIAVIGVTSVFKASEFIDAHPTYAGLTVLFLACCYGFYWLVKRLRG